LCIYKIKNIILDTTIYWTFQIHTQMLQHKAAFKKESADKNKKILLNT
jgi:hypothetical protein